MSRMIAACDNVRQTDRISVSFEAQLREPGTSRFSVNVVDLSATGFRCETSFTLVVGATVWLTIPGLTPIEAVVAWRHQFTAGCEFLHPLHIAVFDHVARMHPSQTRTL